MRTKMRLNDRWKAKILPAVNGIYAQQGTQNGHSCMSISHFSKENLPFFDAKQCVKVYQTWEDVHLCKVYVRKWVKANILGRKRKARREPVSFSCMRNFARSELRFARCAILKSCQDVPVFSVHWNLFLLQSFQQAYPLCSKGSYEKNEKKKTQKCKRPKATSRKWDTETKAESPPLNNDYLPLLLCVVERHFYVVI